MVYPLTERGIEHLTTLTLRYLQVLLTNIILQPLTNNTPSANLSIGVCKTLASK
jgi:hypothetical protein